MKPENEATLQARIMERATALGCRLFRNTVAKAAVGNMTVFPVQTTITVYPGDILIRQGRIIHAGLPVGSGDLIGWTPTIVQGHPVAVFTSVEVKSATGTIREQQGPWRDAVNAAGGAAIIARSLADYEALVAQTA